MSPADIVQKLWNYCNVLRDDGMSYGDYVEQLTNLEKRFESHDEQIQAIFEAIRQLMAPPDKKVKIYPVK